MDVQAFKLVAAMATIWIGITRLFVKKSFLEGSQLLSIPIAFWYLMSLVGTLGFLVALKNLDASLLFPMTSLQMIVIIVGGSLWLGEKISAGRLIGVSVILIGFAILWVYG